MGGVDSERNGEGASLSGIGWTGRTVWWPWTINATGSFCRFLFSSRIPSNTHTVRYVYVRGGKKRSRGFVRSFVRPGGERGGEAHANLSRRFFCSCFLAAVAGLVTRVDSVAPMKRWRTANARRQHIPVLPNGPRYTPRRTFPRVFFSPRASPPPSSFRLLIERDRDTVARLDEAFEIKR